MGFFDLRKPLIVNDFKKLKSFRLNKNYNELKLEVDEAVVTDDFVEMFDVVDSTSSVFVANGLVTHNTSADILKRAIKLLYDGLKGHDAHIVNLVHDEITVECAENEAEEVREILQNAMKEAAEEYLTNIPVIVDAKIIQNWGDK